MKDELKKLEIWMGKINIPPTDIIAILGYIKENFKSLSPKVSVEQKSAEEILYEVNKEYVIEQGDQEMADSVSFEQFLENAGDNDEAREMFTVSIRAMERYKNQYALQINPEPEYKWSELEKIAPPEKWLKVYEHYQELLTKQDVAGFWQEQFAIADAERNDLKKGEQGKINKAIEWCDKKIAEFPGYQGSPNGQVRNAYKEMKQYLQTIK